MPRNDDDEDDRPRNRSRGDGRRDDRDDDRPRRRRDEDEDDDADDDRPRKRRRHDDSYERGRPRRTTKGSNGLAMAGLILGVLSFCTGGLTGLPAIVCSALALGKPKGRGLAIGGLVTGLLGIITWVGIGVAFYTIGRPAAERMRDSNNLKVIALGLHNQHDRAGGFVGPYAVDERGTVNQGLSFRVGLLPYIEQENVYRQFDLTQPWNGPRNQAASNTKIPAYTPRSADGADSTNTPYRVFYGGGALFNENGRPMPLIAITDGTSNTIIMVHATEQVPWAEPREFKYSDTTPLPKFGQPGAKGFHAAFADGSVRFISNTIPERTVRLLITRSEGAVIPPGDW